ncbi:MAG: hypothetical protein AAF681_06865, partial [Pseudomonadota bacterium]
ATAPKSTPAPKAAVAKSVPKTQAAESNVTTFPAPAPASAPASAKAAPAPKKTRKPSTPPAMPERLDNGSDKAS